MNETIPKIVLAILLLIGGGYYIVTLFNENMSKKESMQHWAPTKAVVVEVYRREKRARAGGLSVPQLDTGVRYEYTWKGQTYGGERRLNDGDARTHEKGMEIYVNVNPQNPGQSSYELPLKGSDQ